MSDELQRKTKDYSGEYCVSQVKAQMIAHIQCVRRRVCTVSKQGDG